MQKKLNIYHILGHLCYQSIAGVVFGFGVYMLVNRNYSAAEAGLFMSLACGFSTLIQPVISNFLDNSKKVTVFDAVIIEALLIASMFIVNSLFTDKSIFLALAFIIGSGLFSAVESLMNSYASIFHLNGIEIDFGIARAAGSIGYGSVCLIFGQLTAIYGYKIAVIAGIVFSLALSVAGILLKSTFKKADKKPIKAEKEENVSFKEFIVNNRMFLILCVFLTGIFLAYTGIDNFTLLIVENLGGDSGDMGMVLGFKALIEAISIFFFSKIISKVELKTTLIIGAFSFATKIFLTWFAGNLFMIYFAQFFQATSFAFILPGMVEFVNRNMTRKEAVRGQSFVTMTIGLGSLVSGTVGGAIIDSYGISIMCLVFFIIAAVSAIGYTIVLRKMK